MPGFPGEWAGPILPPRSLAVGDRPCANTDREIWRETPDDYYSPSIHVTQQSGIGINVGGTVIVMPVRDWHALAACPAVDDARVERLASIAYDVDRRYRGVWGIEPPWRDALIQSRAHWRDIAQAIIEEYQRFQKS
jgi:hypothetical protein